MSSTIVKKSNGLSLTTHLGDSAVLLAFDLDEGKTEKFAGFAVHCVTPPNKKGPYHSNEYFLPNRLNFEKGLTREKTLGSSDYTSSDKAPFQVFHWIHFPSAGPGEYQYTAYAAYFKDHRSIELGPKVSSKIKLVYQSNISNLELGFTRGYISSQAYSERFENKNIRPKEKSIDFDTKPYEQQYEWLGAHARQIICKFLEECEQDSSIQVDVFSYDFDEPDIIRSLCKLGERVRVFQDDSKSHIGAKAMEPKVQEALERAGAQVKTGHFHRFAHNKVMIQKKGGKAVKVLTGSANFSLRGLYVQANSILLFNDPDIANLYEQAFEQSFTSASHFVESSIASKWYNVKKPVPLTISFAPHKTAFSLDKVAESIESAKSSVFFAIMEAGGTGPVMPALQNLADNNNSDIFSLGILQKESELKLFKRGINNNTATTSFNYLHKNVPEPFKDEWSGGAGQVIHHKYVVCDFNDKSPVVFCGSSNLSEGGEKSNGDNLLAIYDRKIAICYAVEAIRLFDHYRFRTLQENSTSDNPLVLDTTNKWLKDYYNPKMLKFHERKILSTAIREK